MPKFPDLSFRFTGLAAALLLAFSLHVPSAQAAENTYSENEIMAAAENLFGAIITDTLDELSKELAR